MRQAPNAACSWRRAWPTCSTNTRCTAATGSPPGPKGATSCRSCAMRRVPVPQDQRWQPALWRALAGRTRQRRLVGGAAAGAPVVHGGAGRPGRHCRPVRCRGGWCCSAPPTCPMRPCRHWPQWPRTARCCWWCRTPAASTGPTSSKGGRLFSAAAPAPAEPPVCASLPLAQVPLAAMHAHAHPLLAAWGRQGRDFMRQLDRFDDTTGAAAGRAVRRRRGRHAAAAGAGCRARPAAAGRTPAAPGRPGRPLDRLPHRPRADARGRDPARPAARPAGRAARTRVGRQPH